MIDIHNHILFGVDDGSPNLKTSLQMIRQSASDGITHIILTPHYVHKQKGYSESYEVLEEKYKLLKEEIEKEKLDVQLFLGAELFINRNLDRFLEEKTVHTMANSKYVLVEFPMDSYLPDYDEYLYNITLSGYSLIIAHPERYEFVMKNPEFVKRWTDEGYLLQSNGDSLKDRRKAKVIRFLIENGLLSFIASDGHSPNGRPAILSEAYKEIEKYYSKEIAERLFEKNAECILRDEKVPTMPAAKRKSLFWR